MSLYNQPNFRLHWTCNSPSHYNDFLFRALHKSDFIDLLVHYRDIFLSSHPWKTTLRVGYNSRIQDRILKIDLFLMKRAIIDKGCVFVLGSWADTTSVLLIIICILLNRKYILWTDTPNINRKRRWFLSIPRTIFLHIAFRRACTILCTGTPAIDVLCKMGAAEKKVVNFPCWVDIDVYRPQPLRQSVQSNSFIRFVSSGRVLNFLKGHDLAIRSLAKAFEQAPEVNFEYLIAGTGPDVEKLKELAERLGIGEKVKVLGWIEPNDLVKVFHKSDVLIHPSPTHDAYGVAVIEAMAAGMIVLSSDTTYAGLDRIKHGVNGFIHSAGNVDELASQIVWLLSHPDQIHVIKSEARKTAELWPVSKGVAIVENILQAFT